MCVFHEDHTTNRLWFFTILFIHEVGIASFITISKTGETNAAEGLLVEGASHPVQVLGGTIASMLNNCEKQPPLCLKNVVLGDSSI